MIPVNTPRLCGNEKKYLLECIETGWISSEGPFVQRFESEFSAYCNRKHGVAVANGSAALDIAVKAIGIGAGDEVIMPTFTIISPAQSVVQQGGIPVLVDSDPETWNMDVSQLEEKITPRTKAILVVHIYGLPVDMDPVIELARKHGLKIIEDAAEMHGQTYKGRKCGSFGDISVFSFYPNKHITTGEGGMLVIDDDELAEKCRGYRNLCFQPQKRFVHSDLGWNYRMTNMQAALGCAQLEQIDDTVKRKREIGALYTEKLKGIPGLQLPQVRTEYAENIYWVYGIVVEDSAPFSVDDLVAHLGSKRIGTRPFFWCMHEQPVFQTMGLFDGTSYPVAENMARNGFYVPSGLGMSNDDIDAVVAALRERIGND
ncbi:MAG: DegT/DnrJ/EryC1/StrS family aminotransferase [Pontiellaceae bacterium]|nr:DegT/DnrJ/EryC1/StrS family aminotransferase [Pontiellaceae bacterium]MBN2784147.1 DegT/DnrJ/EryC1/StrS family aminotransferase [Pontiellaceae bacterium]